MENRWLDHATHVEKLRNAYKLLVRESEEKIKDTQQLSI
jgi:hypothetical protein